MSELHVNNTFDSDETSSPVKIDAPPKKSDMTASDRKQMVKDMFQVSTNRGFVTSGQLERIRKSNDRITAGAEWTWDYGAFLFIASMIAGLGLASNSSTTIIASMLVSPLMGPVIGITYGLFVNDFPLMRVSIRREIVSIIMCIIYGAVLSIPMSWGGATKDWPTTEMATRGSASNFVIGIPVAFFSGLGVALSFADENVASLVGVAISASLLPPAVNAGMCWIYAVYLSARMNDKSGAQEFVRIGGMSLALCVMNIFVVFLSGMLMFRIKEVMPIEKGDFWHDLKVARRINTNRADFQGDAPNNKIDQVGSDGENVTTGAAVDRAEEAA